MICEWHWNPGFGFPPNILLGNFHFCLTGYDRSTDQTDKSADLSEFADYRYYQSDKPLYRIGIGSADYKGPYRLIGMGIKRAHIGANLVKFEPLKYIWTP